jgi:hypothetical protein
VIVDNSLNQIYLGTWVAEVTIQNAIGRYIRAFKDKQSVMEKLYFYRAKMKMYAEGTTHISGANYERWKRAEKNMKRIGIKLDRMTRSVVKKKNIKKPRPQQTAKVAVVDSDALEKGEGTAALAGAPSRQASLKTPALSQKTVSAADMDVNDAIAADAIAAFVTFEYTESMARCVEDYAAYSSGWLPIFYYPSRLKFRGHRLHVEKAPEPDEIVWENLETGPTARFFHRVRTTIITIILMAICFAITLQASIYKQRFSDSIPSAKICQEEIPMLYASEGNTSDYRQIWLARAPESVRETRDAACSKIIPGSIYGVYTTGGNIYSPVGSYDTDACTKSLARASGLSDYGTYSHT